MRRVTVEMYSLVAEIRFRNSVSMEMYFKLSGWHFKLAIIILLKRHTISAKGCNNNTSPQVVV